ncbi:MAG: hypothetical protein GIW95_01215 [Candidatus Eremiobacteraeota bacterium]|nr:hypothetical protein [Candidatus Eremiobacteraeota bacterium]
MFEPLDATDTEEMRPANLDAGPPPSAPIGHGNRWAAPLTRRRLRSSDNAITWPQSFDADSPVLDERARCALLERLLSADENPDILALAYRQENVAARTLITRGLSAQPPAAQRKVFQTMYAVGNDAERATAIDAFIKLGASDDLIAAFQDRRESLAARAAYAFGKTHCRAEFHARLASLCEPARLEAIVTLLSGVLS